MPTINDLFKSQVEEIYGKSEKLRIDTQGIINAPRGAALLGSSPDALSSLIGNQIGGALGGSANRPTDTIFRKPTGFFTKPISLLAPTEALLKDAVKEGDKYFVKQSPAPASIIAAAKSSPQSFTGAAISAVNKFGSGNGLKNLANSLKKNSAAENEYGAKFGKTSLDGKTVMAKDVVFSDYYEEHTIFKPTGKPLYNNETNKYVKTLQERKGDTKKSWNDVTKEINEKAFFEDDAKLKESKKSNRFQNQIWVTFKKYGNKEIVPFVGSVSGISEDITPEWSNFKYVGSPFKIYRYQGVERSVKFNLKLYYNTITERDVIIKKINYLKSLAFPYEKISEMTYGNNPFESNGTITARSNSQAVERTSQYAFSPQLFYFSIGDVYTNVLSLLESISFNIEDNVSWPNFQPNGIKADKDTDSILYPSVIDASLSIKIIEQGLHSIDSATKTYKYNFDGNGTEAIESKPAEKVASQNNSIPQMRGVSQMKQLGI
jgi:hypothetical protein